MGVYLKGNRWYIDYYLPDGRRKREVVGPADKITRSLAEKALKARVGEIVQGKFNIEQTKKPVPFETLLSHYLEWAKTNHRAYWRDEYAANVLKKFFSGKTLSQIKSWDVEKYKKKRKDQGRKPETINRELTVLRLMFNLGIKWEMVSLNPVRGVKFMPVPKIPYRTIEGDEFKKFYQASTPVYRLFLLCLYTTGIRRGEILNLKPGDINFDDGYIKIIKTKTDESRTTYLDPLLKEKLRDHLKDNKDEYVFQYIRSRSLTSLYRDLRSIAKKAGITITPHVLRHTFTSNLMTRLKEDPRTVMELTGHKDIRMLMRYTHTKEELKKAAISKLGEQVKSLSIDTSSDTSLGETESTDSENMGYLSENKQ